MFRRRLIVFSGAIHHNIKDVPVAHAGFVKEIEVWSQNFSEVVIVGYKTDEPPLADCISYNNSNITLVFWGNACNTSGVLGKLRLLGHALNYLYTALKILNTDDIVMARGPEAVGFLGALVATLRGNVRFSRYTAQWALFSQESFLHKAEKWFYKRCFNAPVAIYGNTDPNHPHLIPFVTSSVTKEEWVEAEIAIAHRRWASPYRLLSVGRLSSNKNIKAIICAIKILLDRGYDIELHIAGRGEQKQLLVELINDLQINSAVIIHGHISESDLKKLYANAHCLVHAAITEGFPKIYIEAMTYGIPIVASPAGVGQFIIQPCTCGLIYEETEPGVIADYIEKLLNDVTLAKQMGLNGHARVFTANFLIDSLASFYSTFLTDYVAPQMSRRY